MLSVTVTRLLPFRLFCPRVFGDDFPVDGGKNFLSPRDLFTFDSAPRSSLFTDPLRVVRASLRPPFQNLPDLQKLSHSIPGFPFKTIVF